MPFESLAQEGYLHANPEILGNKKLAEFDAATKGKKLPKRKAPEAKKTPVVRMRHTAKPR